MITIQIKNKEDIKKRLDIFLVDYFENKYPRAKITSFIEKFEVKVNQKAQKASYKIKENDLIEINIEELDNYINPDMTLVPYSFNLDIKFEDEDVIVINKPKNMLTHPTKFDRDKTLCNALLAHCKDNLSNIDESRPGIVHRLDKNTAGLIIVAKNNEAHENLAKQIKEKTAKRKYLAIALGSPFEEKKGIINKPLIHYLKDDVKMTVAPEGLEAITCYEVLEEYLGATLVELELKTGRTHQIRAHLSSLNRPIFGDSLYGAKSFMRNEFYNLKTQEQLLQSYYLSFKHPKTNKEIEIQLEEKDFSEDFIKVLKFLRSKNEH